MFVAHGPSFRKGLVVEHFQNIEVYNMVAGEPNFSFVTWYCTNGANTHLTSLPLVSVRRHRHVNSVNVKIQFHLRTNLCCG